MKTLYKRSLLVLNLIFLFFIIGLGYLGVKIFGLIAILGITIGLLFSIGVIFIKKLSKSKSTKVNAVKKIDQVPQQKIQECSQEEEVTSFSSPPTSPLQDTLENVQPEVKESPSWKTNSDGYLEFK